MCGGGGGGGGEERKSGKGEWDIRKDRRGREEGEREKGR